MNYPYLIISEVDSRLFNENTQTLFHRVEVSKTMTKNMKDRYFEKIIRKLKKIQQSMKMTWYIHRRSGSAISVGLIQTKSLNCSAEDLFSNNLLML